MSDVPAASGATVHATTFEQALFERSPVGAWLTTGAIFFLLMGSFAGLSAASHYPLSLSDRLSFGPHQVAWPAAILSLLAAVVLGMQRYARLKDAADAPALLRLMDVDLGELATRPAIRGRLRRAAGTGALVGVAIGVFAVPAALRQDHVAVFLWFEAVFAFQGALFARGAAMTRASSRNFATHIDRDLKIDLLRVDELSVIGRSSARTALIWLCVAAVISLFFVGGHLPGLVIATVLFAAGMAVWIFFRSLERVHRRIVAAKRAELDRLRHAIHAARLAAVEDHAAAARLQGLLAYETRIEHVHEWPFDQLTLLRVGAYVLIPALPAAGQMAFKLLSRQIVP